MRSPCSTSALRICWLACHELTSEATRAMHSTPIATTTDSCRRKVAPRPGAARAGRTAMPIVRSFISLLREHHVEGLLGIRQVQAEVAGRAHVDGDAHVLQRQHAAGAAAAGGGQRRAAEAAAEREVV